MDLDELCKNCEKDADGLFKTKFDEIIAESNLGFPSIHVQVGRQRSKSLLTFPKQTIDDGSYIELLRNFLGPIIVTGQITYKDGETRRGFLRYHNNAPKIEHMGAILFYTGKKLDTSQPEFIDMAGKMLEDVFPYQHRADITLKLNKPTEGKFTPKQAKRPFFIPYEILPKEIFDADGIYKLGFNKGICVSAELVDTKLQKNNGLFFIPGDLTSADGDKTKILFQYNTQWNADNKLCGYYIPVEGGFIEGTPETVWKHLRKTNETFFPFNHTLDCNSQLP